MPRRCGDAPASATAVVGELKLLVPLEGLVDLGAERTRLDKEIKRVEGEIAKCDGKLASETFVQNAPAAVVEQERQRLLDWNAQRDALRRAARRSCSTSARAACSHRRGVLHAGPAIARLCQLRRGHLGRQQLDRHDQRILAPVLAPGSSAAAGRSR